MSDKRWHLIGYDVRDPKRLRQVARILEGHGTRVQYSVFRCRLSQTELEQLHWELNRVMDAVDDLLVVPLCGSCAAKVPTHSSGDRSDWAGNTPTFRIV